MSVTTSAMRAAWGPPCVGSRMITVPLGDNGARITIDRRWEHAIRALDMCFAAYDYEVRKADTGCYNCRTITGGTGYSLHAYGLPPDVNWSTNPYGPRLVTDMPPAMILAIEAIRTVDGLTVWRWGGRYSGNKDAMHFDPQVTPDQIARGIDWATVATTGEDDMTTLAEVQKEFVNADKRAAAREKELRQEIVATLSEREAKTRRMVRAIGRKVGLTDAEMTAAANAPDA